MKKIEYTKGNSYSCFIYKNLLDHDNPNYNYYSIVYCSVFYFKYLDRNAIYFDDYNRYYFNDIISIDYLSKPDNSDYNYFNLSYLNKSILFVNLTRNDYKMYEFFLKKNLTFTSLLKNKYTVKQLSKFIL